MGFLGAGAIIKSGASVRGLTTAGCIWVSASLGMAVGFGYYMPAVIVALFTMFTLVFLNKLEQVYSKVSYRKMNIIVSDNNGVTKDIIDLVKQDDIDVRFCEYRNNLEEKIMDISLVLKIKHKGLTDKLSYGVVENIKSKIQGVKSISWEQVKD